MAGIGRCICNSFYAVAVTGVRASSRTFKTDRVDLRAEKGGTMSAASGSDSVGTARAIEDTRSRRVQPLVKRRDIVVIGASAGGISALKQLVEGLPKDLPASVFVVVHSSPEGPGTLPSVLSGAGPLPAEHASDGKRFQRGHIYVAPPDRHLLLNGSRMRLTLGPRENGFRPAVDALFRTAAEHHGARVVGIVLSGGLNDGTHGLR